MICTVLGGRGKCVPGRGVQTFFLSYKISFITISFYGEHEKDFGGGAHRLLGTPEYVHHLQNPSLPCVLTNQTRIIIPTLICPILTSQSTQITQNQSSKQSHVLTFQTQQQPTLSVFSSSTTTTTTTPSSSSSSSFSSSSSSNRHAIQSKLLQKNLQTVSNF